MPRYPENAVKELQTKATPRRKNARERQAQCEELQGDIELVLRQVQALIIRHANKAADMGLSAESLNSCICMAEDSEDPPSLEMLQETQRAANDLFAFLSDELSRPQPKTEQHPTGNDSSVRSFQAPLSGASVYEKTIGTIAMDTQMDPVLKEMLSRPQGGKK